MHTQHTLLTKTLDVSDSIHQLLSDHIESISHILQIEFCCHSEHDASLPCSAYKIASGNTLIPPHFAPPCQHQEQGIDDYPTL